MNRLFALTLVLLLVLSLGMAGCKEEKQPAESTYVGMDEDFFEGMEPTGQQPSEETAGTVFVTEPTVEQGDEVTIPAQTTPTQTQTQTTEPTVQNDPAANMTFEAYLAMSGDEQRAFAKSFSSMDAFFLWYDQKAEEAGQKDVIEVTGPVDLGQYGN